MDIKITNYKTLVIVLLIVLLGGFISGILGVLFSRAYLRYVPILGDFYVPTTKNGEKEVIIREANKVIVTSDDRFAQVAKDVSDSIYLLARKKSGSGAYASHEVISSALALTSDGWLVASSTIALTPSQHVIVLGKKVLTIEKIARDANSNLIFIKVDSRDLAVTTLTTSPTTSLSQSIFSFNPTSQELQHGYISDVLARSVVGKYENVLDTDVYDQRIKTSIPKDSLLTGSPIFDLEGKVVGVVTQSGVIRASYVNYLFSRLLKNETLEPLNLSIRYMPLHLAQGANNSGAGALLTNTDIKPAVSVNSSLKDQLKAGDIITHVENTMVQEGVDLLDILYSYPLGTSVSLKVVRDGQQVTVEYVIQ